MSQEKKASAAVRALSAVRALLSFSFDAFNSLSHFYSAASLIVGVRGSASTFKSDGAAQRSTFFKDSLGIESE